jgi:hypothetical protein
VLSQIEGAYQLVIGEAEQLEQGGTNL